MGFDLFMLRTPSPLPKGYRPQTADAPRYFRLNGRAMAIVCAAINLAGAGYSDDPPEDPTPYPPPGMSEARAETLLEALSDACTPFQLRKGRFDARDLDATLAMTNEETATLREHYASVERYVRASSLREVDGRQCFGLYKLSSNDGWVVRPDECVVIAAGLVADPDDTIEWLYDSDAVDPDTNEKSLRKLLSQFAQYNAAASKFGGYRVL